MVDVNGCEGEEDGDEDYFNNDLGSYVDGTCPYENGGVKLRSY